MCSKVNRAEEREKDVVLFYYYSSPLAAESCFLRLNKDICYRNMFLMPCPDHKIHFEFPVFEDHSYNTICNLIGLKNLIKRPSKHDKFIIFRTCNQDIVGFYRIERAYYQETDMFNNNGFVWGIEAEPYLVKRGVIKYDGPRLRQGYRASWHGEEWASILTGTLNRITSEENLSHIYSSETNRLIELLKDENSMNAWEEYCHSCDEKCNCRLYSQFERYGKEHQDSNIFCTMNRVYNSNIYSRNVLLGIPKIYLK